MIGNNNTKVSTGRESSYGPSDSYKNLVIGEVKVVDDPQGLGRIKVRVKGVIGLGGDDSKSDADLPWAFPLIPKMLNIQPKVGESVYIFNFGKDKQHVDRIYVGPIISQPQKLNFDYHYGTALAGFSFGTQAANVNINNIPELIGVFPNPSDVSIEGRYNTDIIQKNNEILIRAGKFESSTQTFENPYNFKFNKTTQAFIQIKNDVKLKNDIQFLNFENVSSEKGTVTNIVSNKINLITHSGGYPRFNVTNQTDLISEDELLKILSSETEGGAHRLPFGDVLLEYLKLLKNALLFHVHRGNGLSGTDLATSGNVQAMAEFKSKAEDLEKRMLSNNVRIN
jgi:hypothetical protein